MYIGKTDLPGLLSPSYAWHPKWVGDIMNKVGNASPWACHEHAPLMIGGWLSSTRSQSAKSHPVDGQTTNQFCHCVICIHLRYFGKRACLKPTTCTMRSDAQRCAAMRSNARNTGHFSFAFFCTFLQHLRHFQPFKSFRCGIHSVKLHHILNHAILLAYFATG